jgi:hypothetical protein
VAQVAFFLCHSLEPSIRRDVEDAVVRHYHAMCAMFPRHPQPRLAPHRQPCARPRRRLLANGVENYPWERAWREYTRRDAKSAARLPPACRPLTNRPRHASAVWRRYRLNTWRALISILAMGPSLAQQHSHSTGIFAAEPTKANAQLRVMYEKLNERWCVLPCRPPLTIAPCLDLIDLT